MSRGIFSVQPARNARQVSESRKGLSGGTINSWFSLYGYGVLICQGVTTRSADQTASKPSVSALRAASMRVSGPVALPEIGRKTPNFIYTLLLCFGFQTKLLRRVYIWI